VEHPWSLSALAADPLATNGTATVAAYLLFLLAAMAKAGAMPMHSWIPTMAPTTHASVMAFLPGSLDKVLGIYLLARATVDWFVPSPALRWTVMIVGVVTILCGVLMALVQHDLRRLLAFHAVSQVGYMLLGLGTGTLVGALGAVFHMVNHALYKSGLFLGAGAVERETGTMELDRLGGLGRTMPVTFGCMLVGALSISGVPPLNGFASKWLIYQGCVAADAPWMLLAALFGSVLTLASFVKVLHSVFWGARPARLDGASGRGGIGVPAAMVTLAVLCVGLGVFAAWPLERFVGPAVGLEHGAAAALAGAPATWGPLHGAAAARPLDLPNGAYAPLAVTGLLVLGTLLALGLGYLGAMRSRRPRPAFVGGTPFDREVHRFPGTEFYRTVSELPGLRRALAWGEAGRLDVHEIFRRAGAPLVEGLRRAHTGLLQDYVSWCVLGAAAVLAFLIWS
jgi:formate hydrogenlyase subunit 3/multisubunit Na+/H+ antiporter MnhD subunit